ncbi:MAG: arginine--tRNA ligase [Crocinitomicaceae bacterium]|nr:arginine--tRNA ligase [Crocinitomicaceae bacterium]
MDALDQRLAQSAVQACEACFGAQIAPEHIQLQQTRKEFEGDRTVVVFPLTRHSKSSPEETGVALGQWLVANDELIKAYQVVKGFLNLTIVPVYWTEQLLRTHNLDAFGIQKKGSRSKVMVEYSSPNTNKPLHLGHLRNNFLGYSVARILEAAGHEVIKVQIINDRGIHICKSMVAWQMFGEGETPDSAGLKGDKLVGKYYVAFDRAFKEEVAELLVQGMDESDAKKQAPILLKAHALLHQWEQGNSEVVELWKTMNGWVYDGFEETYSEMGVDFDKLYYESDTYLLGKDQVAAGLGSGVFFKKEDGSVWIDLSDEGLDEKLLLRNDGTAVYMTQDIGTAITRYSDFPGLERQVYTVGNEQEYHFKVLFTILMKLGVEGAKNNHHLSYGMVELPEGKMKSREGTVVDADDLLEEMANTAEEMANELGKIDDLTEEEKATLFKQVGYGALKYFLLKVSPTKSMMFDPKASIDFIGNTAPFIQFNYVRAASMLAKCADADIDMRITSIDASVWDADELRLIQQTLMWPSIVELAAEHYDPSLVANHVYDLTKAFSRWYQDHPVLGEENVSLREARIALTQSVAHQIRIAMGLLGIEMPKRM